jgi:hypothetical protein
MLANKHEPVSSTALHGTTRSAGLNLGAAQVHQALTHLRLCW